MWDKHSNIGDEHSHSGDKIVISFLRALHRQVQINLGYLQRPSHGPDTGIKVLIIVAPMGQDVCHLVPCYMPGCDLKILPGALKSLPCALKSLHLVP